MPEGNHESENHKEHSKEIATKINIDKTDGDDDKGEKVFEYGQKKRQEKEAKNKKIRNELDMRGTEEPCDFQDYYGETQSKTDQGKFFDPGKVLDSFLQRSNDLFFHISIISYVSIAYNSNI